MAEESVQRPDYERTDANPLLIVALAAGLAIYLVATPFVLLAFYPTTRHDPVFTPTALPPAPRLQIDPRGDFEALRARENEQLATFGWIDRPNGIVHLPIGRAIELTLKRGLPGWKPQ